MKKTLVVLAVSILTVYIAIAALMLDIGGIFGGSASPEGGAYTVSLLLNDVSIGNMASIEGGVSQFNINEEFALSEELPAAEPNNRSFVFGGWYMGSNRVYTFADVQREKGSSKNVQVSANWKFKEFAIGETMFEVTLNLNGGMIYGINYVGVVYGRLDKKLPTPERPGYLFGGWYYQGLYTEDESNRVETHEDIIPFWNEENRPNFISVSAWWEVRPPQWWEVLP